MSKIGKRLTGVAAAVALSAGLVVSTTAPAQAGGTVWDKVAQCESSGNWKINTGNGFYGGLQFSSRTWQAFGGKAYASSAHRATKAEQIAIARRTLAAQGPGAWPVCGRKAGLTKSNGGANRHATVATHPGSTHHKSTKASAKKVANKAAAKKKAVAKQAPRKAGKTVNVKTGDTIRKIANRHDVSGGWKGLWKLNSKTVKNPNVIYVGQVLKIRR